MKLEVGGKYKFKANAHEGYFVTILGIDGDRFWAKDSDGYYYTQITEDHLLPYEEPVKEVEWKTFLIEAKGYLTESPCRVFQQYLSIEDARKDNDKAISITEIKLKFETV